MTSREIYDRHIEGLSYDELAELTGLSYEAVRSRIRRYSDTHAGRNPAAPEQVEPATQEDFEGDDQGEEDLPETTFQVKGDTAFAGSNAPEIKTLDQLIAVCQVDLEKWRVKDFFANAWSMGRKHKRVDLTWENGAATGFVDDTGGWNVLQNYQIKAWFVPRHEYSLDVAVKRIIDKVKSVAPVFRPVKSRYPEGTHLFLPSLYDAHFNKMATSGQYTLADAANAYKKTAEAMLERALGLGIPVDKVLFVAGQDALNTDNYNSTTTHGTWVETADDQAVAVEILCSIVSEVISMYHVNLAPVDVLVVPGNHDKYSSLWLHQYLKAWFRNNDDIRILGHPGGLRYYYHYGVNLLGVDHGETGKPNNLALTMAVEAPHKWANSVYREYLRGHLHQRQELYHPVVEDKGVLIRFLPALCPPDKWHLWKRFVGSHRAAEGLFYHKDRGPAGVFPVFVDEVI